MATLSLPRTEGCLVCGRDNPHGLKLRLTVDDATGLVTAHATPTQHHIGFDDVVHGGLIATIADEAMVWAATWRVGRFCYCGELLVRYRRPVRPGMAITVEARIESARSRLITTSFRCINLDGEELSSGSAKYVPLPAEENVRAFASFIDEDTTREAARRLRGG